MRGFCGIVTQPNLPIFNVEALLEQSLPRGRYAVGAAGGGWVFGLAVPVTVVVLVALLIARSEPDLAPAMQTAVGFAVLAVFLAFAMGNFARAQRAAEERRLLDQLEDLMTLRRWPEAAALATGLLSGPMTNHLARVRALVFLSGVLSRYHQFSAAVEVHNHLLQNVELDPGLELTLKVARALALLREDRLLDADRAIAELRRVPAAGQIAGVGLVELYRDVKTGHPDEAIALFERRRDQFGPQLGHRAADAFALASLAYDTRGAPERAAQLWQKATLLMPVAELLRRYPELRSVADAHLPAPAPREAA